nr:zinc finger, CCHC-type [Tanacetum cinerariifolium]
MSEGKNKEIIVHREVASLSQFQCPILKSTNYTVWALRIKTILRANGLWDIIEPSNNAQLDIKKDMAATSYLYQALPEDMILQVASCNSAKEIWEALQTRHIGVDRVQKARLQTLKTKFQMLKIKEDDSIAFEERVNLFNGSPSDNQDKLLFSNHDNSLSHEKGFKNGGQEKFKSYQDNKQDGKTKQFNNEKKPSHKFKRNNFQKGTKDSSKVKCYNCNKFGHVRRNCKLKDKGQEQSNLVQEDVEPMLLMAVQEKRDKGKKIFLNEKEIKPKKYISMDESLWYLDNGASSHMTGIRTHFKEDQKLLMRVERSRNRLYKINLKVGMPMRLLANLENHAWLWHARLGHLNFDSIKQMTQKKLVEGIPSINHKNQVCNACLLGKHSRAPFPNQTNTKSSETLNLVCGDLCGPISSKTESGKKYMFLLVDDCTRYMWVYFLKSKDEAFETFKEFKLKVKNEVGKKIKSIRIDRGGEFTSREFTRYCKENGILRQLTAPYSPQQNGIVKRRNRSVMSTTRSMLKAMHMPQIFWAEAIRHAVYVLNRVTKPHLKKLDDKSRELVYLGTQPGSKAYRLFNPVTKDMVVSRDVKFKEDEGWDWKGYLDNINPSKPEWRDFIISENQTSSSRIIDEVSTQDLERNYEDSAPSPIQNNTHDDISDDDEIKQPIDNPSTPPPYTYEPNSKDSTGYTSTIASSSRPLDHTPVRGYRNLFEIYNRAPEVQSDELLLLEEEPRYYKEAAQDKKRIEAMQIEIDSINKNKTWKLATLPDNQKAIGLKWVFKTKRDGNGNIIKHKAHLVTKGYVQEHGIDYDEVFAPVARMETFRLILALSAYHGWEQAPRAWNMKLDQTLKSLNFKKCTLEQAIYTRVRKDSMLLVGVYVDDLIAIGSKVTQTEDRISIKQTGYANKILKKARMVDCNKTKIPMDPGTKLIKIEGGELVDATEYRSLIGCLRYLLHTRPDLSYSVGLLSRFMQEPREQHIKAIRQGLRYIKGTLNFGINYYKKDGCKLLGYSDSSYGINIEGGRGTTWIVFYFGNSPISWSSQKQPTVALSSCESEFMAATAAACQAL